MGKHEEEMLDEVARRRGIDPNRARAVREAAERDATVHARPDYDHRTDVSTFPCGLPGDADVRVAWDPRDMTCAACIASERARVAREMADAAGRKAHYDALPTPCAQPCSCARCQEETCGMTGLMKQRLEMQPELLEGCAELVECFGPVDTWDGRARRALERAIAVIAKARAA